MSSSPAEEKTEDVPKAATAAASRVIPELPQEADDDDDESHEFSLEDDDDDDDDDDDKKDESAPPKRGLVRELSREELVEAVDARKGLQRMPSRESSLGTTGRRSSTAVQLRHPDEMGPMAKTDRIKRRMQNLFRMNSAEIEPDEEEGNKKQKQYRLETTTVSQSHFFLRCLGIGNVAGTLGIGLSPNQSLAMSLHWMFRVNFFFLFALSCVVFFALVIVFAALIVAAGRMDPECVRIGGEKFEVTGATFADGFALSWTTFSTVGYGSTYPALGHENDNPSNCLFITAICSLESFVGVLYSGFCGAILFGKVLRIQSHAQVIFSDPIVIRYGDGVEAHDDEEDEANKHARIPCPVLEFRIVNRLFNEVGGEIMDATLNVVANVDAADTIHPMEDDHHHDHHDDHHDDHHHDDHHHDHHDDHHHDDHHHDDHHEGRLAALAHTFTRNVLHLGKGRHFHHTPVEEDPTAQLVSKRVFSKLLIEASDHPFFKRVWLARHVLDDTSPILTPKVRRTIRRNGGFWPEQLNNYNGVKESLQFNQILVSLNGVSNVSASDVYGQKIYDRVDVNVGYQFVNLLYRDGDTLKVDTDLINDVREQPGGGGEPLTLETE